MLNGGGVGVVCVVVVVGAGVWVVDPAGWPCAAGGVVGFWVAGAVVGAVGAGVCGAGFCGVFGVWACPKNTARKISAGWNISMK